VQHSVASARMREGDGGGTKRWCNCDSNGCISCTKSYPSLNVVDIIFSPSLFTLISSPSFLFILSVGSVFSVLSFTEAVEVIKA
jgi:hypothetical protein